MTTILLPTDYSANADHALAYALYLAKLGPTKLIIVHVGEILIPTSTPQHLYEELREEAHKEKREELIVHVNRLLHHYHIPSLEVEYAFVDGFSFQGEMETAIEHYQPDLLVMGTTGASGLLKWLGSNTSNLIANSKVPVLAVPEKAPLKTSHTIAYASDLKDLVAETATLVQLAQRFNWHIAIFHIHPVYPQWVDPSKPHLDALAKELEQAYPNQSFSIHLVKTEEENDVKQGIETYVQAHHPDVLAMFPAKRTFLDKLFDPSNTVEVVLQTTVPLLAMKANL